MYYIKLTFFRGGNAHDCYTKQKSEIFSHYRELHLAQEITYKNLCLVRSNQAPCKSGRRLRVNKLRLP